MVEPTAAIKTTDHQHTFSAFCVDPKECGRRLLVSNREMYQNIQSSLGPSDILANGIGQAKLSQWIAVM